MALTYLSGDKKMNQVGRTKKQRQEKRAKNKAKRKAGRKGKGHGVVKIAKKVARASAITLITINAFGIAKKLAKLWGKPAGKSDLTDMWTNKFGGEMDKLKTAISKGSKTSISGDCDEMGIAVEVIMATALPIIQAVRELFRRHKDVVGDDHSDLDAGIDNGSKELNSNPAEHGTIDEGGDGSDDTSKGSFFSAFGMCFWGSMQLMMIQKSFTNPILLFICSLIGTYLFFGLFLGMIYQSEHKWKKYISWYFDYPMNLISNIFSYGKNIFSKK